MSKGKNKIKIKTMMMVTKMVKTNLKTKLLRTIKTNKSKIIPNKLIFLVVLLFLVMIMKKNLKIWMKTKVETKVETKMKTKVINLKSNLKNNLSNLKSTKKRMIMMKKKKNWRRSLNKQSS